MSDDLPGGAPLTPVQRRLLAPAEADPDGALRLTFQHTVLCQVGLPYRDPGDDVRQWQRVQGGSMLVVQAGQVLQPREGTVRDVGLPWGTNTNPHKDRLMGDSQKRRSVHQFLNWESDLGSWGWRRRSR